MGKNRKMEDTLIADVQEHIENWIQQHMPEAVVTSDHKHGLQEYSLTITPKGWSNGYVFKIYSFYYLSFDEPDMPNGVGFAHAFFADLELNPPTDLNKKRSAEFKKIPKKQGFIVKDERGLVEIRADKGQYTITAKYGKDGKKIVDGGQTSLMFPKIDRMLEIMLTNNSFYDAFMQGLQDQ